MANGKGPGRQDGIYVDIGGMLFEIVSNGDIVDGRTVSFVSSGREALSGDELAFWAQFTDGSSTSRRSLSPRRPF